jgi:phosphoribosyl 1,2-cyclic phosphodiesterase
MLGFCPLASGSKGNALYLGTKKSKILIDAGLPAKVLQKRLADIGVELEEIDGICITHEHSDHIRGLETLTEKWKIPIFANSDTAQAICSTLGIVPKFKIFTTGETFEFGDIEIHPFSIQHDAIDPVGFAIIAENSKIGVCADLGFVTTLVAKELQDCDYLYIESNHQVSMVHSSSRPQMLKQRILSRQGHLSNEQCAGLIELIYHPGLKHIHLAHLSSECNAPELALKIIREKLTALNAATEVSIALQDAVSNPVYFTQLVI